MSTSEINVMFTTLRGTLAAMRVAAALARATGARLRLIQPRLATYPLRSAGYALAAEPEVVDADREREQVVATAGLPVEVLVSVCGRIADAAALALHDHSLVIIGGHRSWLPTQLERLQRTLESLGHVVVFVNEADHVA
ncbi:MAG: hypothetical protein ND807_13965 [Vicinamibacterales bacterium]|nr:hypothetical protein [Vicinamibacterales bacterium]